MATVLVLGPVLGAGRVDRQAELVDVSQAGAVGDQRGVGILEEQAAVVATENGEGSRASAQGAGAGVTLGRESNLGLVVLLTVTYFSSSRRLQGAATGLFLAAQGYGLFFVWATPTDLG